MSIKTALLVGFFKYTPQKFNSSPLKKITLPKKETRLPAAIFEIRGYGCVFSETGGSLHMHQLHQPLGVLTIFSFNKSKPDPEFGALKMTTQCIVRLLLMVQKSHSQPPFGCKKNLVDNGRNYQLPTSTGDRRISEPSTVWMVDHFGFFLSSIL